MKVLATLAILLSIASCAHHPGRCYADAVWCAMVRNQETGEQTRIVTGLHESGERHAQAQALHNGAWVPMVKTLDGPELGKDELTGPKQIYIPAFYVEHCRFRRAVRK